jgi:hypothetical protein
MNEAPKSADNKAVSLEPEKVDKDTADRLNSYAQSLDDPITHVVDYGGLTDNTQRKNKNA